MLASNRLYSTSGLRQVKVIPLFITALRRQLILAPVIQEELVPDIQPAPVTPLDPDHMIHHEDDIDIITDIDTDPYLPEESDKYNDNDIGNKFDVDGNIQYWYNLALNDRTKIKRG